MKQRVPVSQIMSKELITLTPTQSLYDAERLFKKHNIRHIPVVEGDKIIGIVSYSDLLRISFADMTDGEDEVTSVVYDMYTIPQIMAKTPLTVGRYFYQRSSRNPCQTELPLYTRSREWKTCWLSHHHRPYQIFIRTILKN